MGNIVARFGSHCFTIYVFFPKRLLHFVLWRGSSNEGSALFIGKCWGNCDKGCGQERELTFLKLVAKVYCFFYDTIKQLAQRHFVTLKKGSSTAFIEFNDKIPLFPF